MKKYILIAMILVSFLFSSFSFAVHQKVADALFVKIVQIMERKPSFTKEKIAILLDTVAIKMEKQGKKDQAEILRLVSTKVQSVNFDAANPRKVDTTVKTDLQQIATAIQVYSIDMGKFPTGSGGALFGKITDIQNTLQVYLNTVPQHPLASETYYYGTITKNGIAHAGYVLIGKTSTELGNIILPNGIETLQGKTFEDIQKMIVPSIPEVDVKNGYYVYIQ